MDGGIHALKGFIYQATVILEVLMGHLESRTAARARPEGIDDLELSWTEGGVRKAEYVQIKKPRENDQGQLKLEAWTLRELVQELLPAACAHLDGNDGVQRWILGDDVEPDAKALVAAGEKAPDHATGAFLHAVHLLAREQSGVTDTLSKPDRQSIGQWRFHPEPNTPTADALARMTEAFAAKMTPRGITRGLLDGYAQCCKALYASLPEVLARIRLEGTFGLEDQVKGRVIDLLSRTYPLSRERIVDTIWANMQGFVNDVAVRRGQWIEREDLDGLVARAWPDMMVLREPPPLPTPYVDRSTVVEMIVGMSRRRATEVVGVAGSGKTSLARATYDHIKRTVPGSIVLYAEVRYDRTFREVLTALAFHLARDGSSAARDAVTRPNVTEEQRATEVARALVVPGPTVLLVDLVEGDCSDEFARLLARFLSGHPTESCSILLFGQGSALRGLTSLERTLAGFPGAIELPGLQFEEFLQLVNHFHRGAERERVWNVYQRAAAGRVAGLFARLAYDLARAPSLDAMEQVVAAPPDQVVPRAVRQRLEALHAAVRPAAEKVACFVLPFESASAIDVFPDDRIKSAVDDLLSAGLLQHHDSDRLEMHETVRRSIEDGMAPASRQQAHARLADWYGRRDQVLAEILHLDKAGHEKAAHDQARATFRSGKHQFALMGYVMEHRLISGSELATELLGPVPAERRYLIAQLLQKLGNAETAQELLTGLQGQPARFDADYQWAWRMVESTLACDPRRLYELAQFALSAAGTSCTAAQRFECIIQGCRRTRPQVTAELLALFDAQPDEVKWQMLGVLLLDPHREALQRVIPFIETTDRPQNHSRSHVARPAPPFSLALRERDDVVALLAALPLPETSTMIVTRGPQLGATSEVVWTHRAELAPVCVELLRSGHSDDTVLENALRVLAFLGDERALDESGRYRGQRSRLGNLASFVPTMFPDRLRAEVDESKLLDETRSVNERSADFSVIAAMTTDLGGMARKLRASDPKNARLWDFLLLSHAMLRPFHEAVPILEQELEKADDQQIGLLAPILFKLGQLEGPAVTAMLVRALSHPSGTVRMFACLALRTHRSRLATGPLLDLAEREADGAVAGMALTSLAASGPQIMVGTPQLWSRTPGGRRWRTVLAGRLRARSEATTLVNTALDATAEWQLRRAAILAAGHLPFDLALAPIVEAVLLERSPFSLDTNHALVGHQALCAALPQLLAEEHREDVKKFGAFPVLEAWVSAYLASVSFVDGAPDGAATVGWATQKLFRNGRASSADVHRLLDELHVPMLHAAVLRGLRFAGQRERLLEIGQTADSRWLLLRACSEYTKGQIAAPGMHDALRKCVASSRFPDDPFVGNVLSNAARRAPPTTGQGTPTPPVRPSPTVLTASDVEVALTKRQIEAHGPWIVSPLSDADADELGRKLEPFNDYVSSVLPAEPSLSFVVGTVTVGGVRPEQRDNGAKARTTLRPAVAAASRVCATAPWHCALLEDPTYLLSFLIQLGRAANFDRFYEELAVRAADIVPWLDDFYRVDAVLPMVDERFVPHLIRFAGTGTDALLEGLSRLATRVHSAAIDPALAALFHRWHHRFDRKSKRAQHQMNIPLWRAFASLTAHPRFRQIPDYDLTIAELARLPLVWYQKRDLVRVLLTAPRAYVSLEEMLFDAAPFEHWFEDDVDRLDDAADHLFDLPQEEE